MRKKARFVVMLGLFGLVGGMVFGFAGGTGEPHDPYQIENWFHLDNVRNDLQASYVLNNDLDQNTGGYSDLVDTAEGWAPIMGLFAGTFDGGGNRIKDLYIDRNTETALFWRVYSGGSVSELGLENIDINNTGFGSVGAGLAVLNQGTITRVYTTGTMNVWSGGGLVGENFGNITECYSSVTVNAEHAAGGLVYMNDGGISDSFATGVVNANDYAGGLVFTNDGDISDSFATGDVNANLLAAGFVSMSYSGHINNSYSTGKVLGGTSGGFLGYNFIIVDNNFWDMDSSGVSQGVVSGSSDGVTGKTASKMKDPQTFSSWDFDNTWKMSGSDSQMEGYPVPQWYEETTSILDWHQY